MVQIPIARGPPSRPLPGSQLERNRAFWRMISASFMQVSDAHLHCRNRRRSASVTRSSATPPSPLAHHDHDGASSASSSDTADAGAADDGDYELEELSAGNTPRRRSATCSRAIYYARHPWAHSATHLISADLCCSSARACNRGSSRSPIPDLRGIGDHPHPRFPSGVPCPGSAVTEGPGRRHPRTGICQVPGRVPVALAIRLGFNPLACPP